jgi:hypothetical protein
VQGKVTGPGMFIHVGVILLTSETPTFIIGTHKKGPAVDRLMSPTIKEVLAGLKWN